MRYIVPVLAILGLIGILAAIKTNQIQTLISAGEKAKAAGPPPEAVSTALAKKDSWATTLTAVGSVAAGEGVTISNDAAGIVKRILFESGDTVKAGAVLVELDTSVERAQLASAVARLELAKTTLARTRQLTQAGVATTAELDSAQAAEGSGTADVSALRAQIERKVVRAPFAGKLGIRAVNVGQYLSPGSALTTLQSQKETYIDFTLPQQELEGVRPGLPVTITLEKGSVSLSGVIAAVEPSVSESTRAATLRATATDPDKRLRPGMFVDVAVSLEQKRDVVMVPLPAVVYAPYGDSVFLVEDSPESSSGKVARQQFVKLGESTGDYVEIEKGLAGGELLVSAGAFKLRNGAPVVIHNEVELEPKLQPHPVNH